MERLSRSDLVVISQGKELRERDWCYYINPLFPGVISHINLKVIHPSSKGQIIKWIRDGRIYVKIKRDYSPDVEEF